MKKLHKGILWAFIICLPFWLWVYSAVAAAPTFVSATVNAAGTTLTIVFSEAVTFGAGGNAGWTFVVGGAEAITYASGDTTTSLVYAITNRTIKKGETGTLDYIQPGNGVENIGLEDFATIGAAKAIVNSSTVPRRYRGSHRTGMHMRCNDCHQETIH